jgi:hypothetical protein
MRRSLFRTVKWTVLLLALGQSTAHSQDPDPFGTAPERMVEDADVSPVPAQAIGLPANLVPAQFNAKQDALGFSWMVAPQGMLQAVNNSVFQTGQYLQINNNAVDFTSSGQAMMTADQKEYVFTGNANGIGNIRVTRRIKLDLAAGSVRFVDTYQNSGPAAQTVNIQLTNNLQINGSSAVLGPSGTQLASMSPRFGRMQIQSAVGKKDCGLVIVPQARFQMPAVIFYLAGVKSRLKPTIISNNGRDLVFTYGASLPPNKSFTIVHGMAQRNSSAMDAKSLAVLFKPFQARAWIADLPAEVRKTIANLGKTYAGEEMPGGPMLQPLLDAAARWGVERGAADVLVQDEQSQLAGKLQGGEITADSRFGKRTIPLDEAALIVGGASGESPMRLYLRNGEILAGELTSKELRFKTANGLEAKLLPAQIHHLFLHALPGDGANPASAAARGTALVETHYGERLIARGKPGAKFQAATPWGTIQFTLDELQGLYLRRDPQPVYRLLLKDGSRLPVMLRDAEMDFETVRFGAIKLPAAALSQIRVVAARIASASENDDEEPSGEPKVPYCTLAGDNVLVGVLADPQIHLQTTTGTLSVATARVQLVEQREGAASLFAIDTGGPEPVVGTLADDGQQSAGAASLAIRRGGQVWHLPAHHVVGYRVPKAEAAEDVARPASATPSPKPTKAVRRAGVHIVPATVVPPASASPFSTPPPAYPSAPFSPVPVAPPATYPQPQPAVPDADPFGSLPPARMSAQYVRLSSLTCRPGQARKPNVLELRGLS